jgi:hypothetical protein
MKPAFAKLLKRIDELDAKIGRKRRLTALVDVDVLDRDLLRALATVAIETFEQRRICPRELVRLPPCFGPRWPTLPRCKGIARRSHATVAEVDASQSW